MSGSGVDIDHKIVKKVITVLSNFQQRKDLMHRISNVLTNDIRLRFRQSKAPDGTPWAALSPKTIKARRGKKAQILVDKGILKNSFTASVKSYGVDIGTAQKKAKYLHYGTKHMPARPIIAIAKPQEDKIDTVINRWVSEVMSA